MAGPGPSCSYSAEHAPADGGAVPSGTKDWSPSCWSMRGRGALRPPQQLWRPPRFRLGEGSTRAAVAAQLAGSVQSRSKACVCADWGAEMAGLFPPTPNPPSPPTHRPIRRNSRSFLNSRLQVTKALRANSGGSLILLSPCSRGNRGAASPAWLMAAPTHACGHVCTCECTCLQGPPLPACWPRASPSAGSPRHVDASLPRGWAPPWGARGDPR